ncbi:MAG TPA: general secretion pathway protein GspB [Solimonas sp.]|nr:general secretion pathway protein GspB [Solimonas sp.]
MSLILDALRKAERERNVGKPAGMDALVQPFPALVIRPQRPVWPWLAGATILLLVVALSVLLVRRHRASPPPPVAAAPVPAPAPVAQPPPALIPAEEVMDLPEEPEPELASADPEPEPDMGSSTLITPPPRPLTPVDVETLSQVPQSEPAPEPEEPARPATEVETVTLDPAPEPALRRYKDLPSSYRADFPKLTIDVLVYDAQPALRWAMVSGKRYREGETTVEGPRIAQIAREGVVLEYRGEKFLYPL